MSLAEDFFSGIPIPVEAELIERELSRLWKPAPEPAGEERTAAGAAPALHVTRACLSNLIFHAPEPAEVKRTLELARDVGRRFPSRVILWTHAEQESRGPRLRAWVTALCHSSKPDAVPVCCEQIVLSAGPGSIDVFPGAVLPLLVPDVPVLLVLPPGCDGRTAAILDALADRIIFDSRAAPLSALETPRRTLGRECVSCDDLAWRAGLPWRSALCDIFDEPMARPMLSDIRRLEIEYEASGELDGGFPGAAPAALLGSWFADRLGWALHGSAAKDGELSATFEKGGDRLALCLRPREKLAGPAGDIVAARLCAAGDAFVELEARADAAMFEVHYRTPTACVLPRRMPLPRPAEAELLGSAIERVTHQGVLRGALEIAAGLTEGRQSP